MNRILTRQQKSIIILSLFVLFNSCSNFQKSLPTRITVDNWTFSNNQQKFSYHTQVPGSIHSDLLSQNLIPDPFYGSNENDLQWIDTIDWVYTTTLEIPKLKDDQHAELIFNGLDTYTKILLNDSLIAETNNMFLKYKYALKKYNLSESNELKVVFISPQKKEKVNAENLDYDLPGGNRSFTRKAAYQYGWDWGPKFITSGIWQPVELLIWETAIIRDIQYTLVRYTPEQAEVQIVMDIESDGEMLANIQLKGINEDIGTTFKNVNLKAGRNGYKFNLRIRNPKLWWTHNLGDPFLYHFNVQLQKRNKLLDEKDLNIGLRSIELIRDKDEYGESFYFELNGIPVFMKGANYVPQDVFPGRVTDEHYMQIINDVVDANMNMLRVWGGGIYEKDLFYDLCDKEGVLIWQDFMFANTMYPSTDTFLYNIKEEVKSQLQRLRNHPCIAAWCGNNEIDEAWHNWDWSDQYSWSDSIMIWENYKKIFEGLLPKIAQKAGHIAPYISTSPMFGRGNPRSSYEGDSHYWYVWHDAYDFEWYDKVTGRFMSEFGFQGFPSMETISMMDSSDIHNLDDPEIIAHQKHWRGMELIAEYMDRYFPVPEKFEDYVYVSQLLQAYGIITGIEAQRRAKPFCMGSLYWQLNDCWPAISWSSIDYSGNWKALHYHAKKAFENTSISVILEDNSYNVYLISDELNDVSGKLDIEIMDFKGNVKSEYHKEITIGANSSEIYCDIPQNSFAQIDPRNHFIKVSFENEGDVIAESIEYFNKPKDLLFEYPEIKISSEQCKEGYLIVLETDILAKNVFLNTNTEGFFTDNYFDLLPGFKKTIIFETEQKIDDFESKILVKTLNDIALEISR